LFKLLCVFPALFVCALLQVQAQAKPARGLFDAIHDTMYAGPVVNSVVNNIFKGVMDTCVVCSNTSQIFCNVLGMCVVRGNVGAIFANVMGRCAVMDNVSIIFSNVIAPYIVQDTVDAIFSNVLAHCVVVVDNVPQEPARQQQQLPLAAGPSMVPEPTHTFRIPVLPVYPLVLDNADIIAARMMGLAGVDTLAMETLNSPRVRVSSSSISTGRRGSSLGGSSSSSSSVGGGSDNRSSVGSSGGVSEEDWAEPLSLARVVVMPLEPVCVVGLAALAVAMGFKADGSYSPLWALRLPVVGLRLAFCWFDKAPDRRYPNLWFGGSSTLADRRASAAGVHMQSLGALLQKCTGTPSLHGCPGCWVYICT
jgi:uncharacterized membrane protein YgcG